MPQLLKKREEVYLTRKIKRKPTDFGPVDRRSTIILYEPTGKKFVKRRVSPKNTRPYTRSETYNIDTPVRPQVQRQKIKPRSLLDDPSRKDELIFDQEPLQRASSTLQNEFSRAMAAPESIQRFLPSPKHVDLPPFIEGEIDINGYEDIDMDDLPPENEQKAIGSHILSSIAIVQGIPGVSIPEYGRLQRSGASLPAIIREFPIILDFDGRRENYEKVVRMLRSQGMKFRQYPKIRQKSGVISDHEAKKMEKFTVLRDFIEKDPIQNIHRLQTQTFVDDQTHAIGIGRFDKIKKEYPTAIFDDNAKEKIRGKRDHLMRLSKSLGPGRLFNTGHDIDLGRTMVNTKVLGDALRVFPAVDVYTVKNGPLLLRDHNSSLGIIIAEVSQA